jgi:hypothetical protein
MNVTQIIFERGLELSRARNSVKMATDDLSLVQIFAAMREKYGVRPILLTETIRSFGDTPRERHAVLTLDGLDQLNLQLSSLELPQGLPKATYVALLRPTVNVQYTAGALLYHCQELALLYTHICDTAFGIRQIMPIEGDYSSLGNQSEPYYEIEALITAARRTYDALRYVLWKTFGAGGNTPSNFSKTLAACDKLPEPLRSSLETSWATYGIKMTAYRDCIQHYVPVTFDLHTASLERVAGDIWSVRLRLPDNPEKKSQSAFEFAGNLDALTYGWELANEVFKMAAEVFASIPTQ